MMRLAVILWMLPTLLIAGSLVPAGRFVWDHPLETFGGFSGLEVFPNGRFVTISDRGSFFAGRIMRVNGEIISAELDSYTPIQDSKGTPLSGHNADAEGLAVSPNGDIYISFEANHRVMRHITQDSAGVFLPKHADFSSLQNNSGLEALAINSVGVIFSIPERSGKLDRPFPVYRYDGNWSIPFAVPRRGAFLITDADFGPDDRLYVLERDFTWFGGFSTRIRRFEVGENGLTAEETLFESRVHQFDNLEGMSVWQDENHQTRLTMISDDNFNPLQSTEIVEFLVLD